MNNYDRKDKESFKKLKGLEIFEITPVILGGNPIDIKNKTFLNRREHIQACRYWNKFLCELKIKI